MNFQSGISKINDKCIEYENLLSSFYNMSNNIEKEINISKIVNKRNDSIIYFKEELLLKHRKGFDSFDIILNFSKIKFNKEYDKAIIIASWSKSKLDGNSSLYYLELKDSKWGVKCQTRISIS